MTGSTDDMQNDNASSSVSSVDVALEENELAILDSLYTDAINKIRNHQQLTTRINSDIQSLTAQLRQSEMMTGAAGLAAKSVLETILKTKGIEDVQNYQFDPASKKLIKTPCQA